MKKNSSPAGSLRATQFFEFLRGIAQSAVEGDTVRLSRALGVTGERQGLIQLR